MAPVTQGRWVTFDCYGTLVDWQRGLASMLWPLAGERTHDVVRAYRRYERRVRREQPHTPYKDVLASGVVRAAADTGVRIPASAARALTRSWAALRPFDDAEALLAELRARGYRLAVLANCDDELFEVTHRIFRAPFDLFVTADRIRGYTPHPWLFRAFELLARARRADWVHVGCDWQQEIAPARALGIKRVWFDREHSGDDPAAASAHVRTADEAVEAIEQLFECPVAA